MINSDGKEVRCDLHATRGSSVLDSCVLLSRERAVLRQVVIAAVGDKDSPYEELLSVLPASDCRYGGVFSGRPACKLSAASLGILLQSHLTYIHVR